jgi:hypothetical protein
MIAAIIILRNDLAGYCHCAIAEPANTPATRKAVGSNESSTATLNFSPGLSG